MSDILSESWDLFERHTTVNYERFFLSFLYHHMYVRSGVNSIRAYHLSTG